jgi:HlyD family secretion protein
VNSAKRDRSIAGAILLVALLALTFGVWRASAPTTPVIEGIIDAQQIDVGSKVAGRVLTVNVRLGDYVPRGKLLFTIDSPETRAALAAAEGASRSAQGSAQSANGLSAAAQGAERTARGTQASASANEQRTVNGPRVETIEAARAQYASAQAAQRQAAVTNSRTQALYAAQAATAQERDTAANAFAIARAQARSSFASLRALEIGSRREDVAASQGEVAAAGGALASALGQQLASEGQMTTAAGLRAQAESAVQLARAELDDTSVRAPAAGRVTEVDTNPGELAPQGYPVVSLLEIDAPWATFNVPETLLPRFREGIVVRVRLPALGSRVEDFRVYSVSSLGAFATERATRITTGEDLRTFEVRARPVSADADLRAGMSVVVDQ